MLLFMGDGRDLVVNADTAPLTETLLNHPLECEAVGVTPDAVDRYPGHSWTRFSKKDVASGVGFPQKTTWPKGERCSEISPIRRLCRDAFDPVPLMEAVRLATPRSVHQEAVLGSITTI